MKPARLRSLLRDEYFWVLVFELVFAALLVFDYIAERTDPASLIQPPAPKTVLPPLTITGPPYVAASLAALLMSPTIANAAKGLEPRRNRLVALSVVPAIWGSVVVMMWLAISPPYTVTDVLMVLLIGWIGFGMGYGFLARGSGSDPHPLSKLISSAWAQRRRHERSPSPGPDDAKPKK